MIDMKTSEELLVMVNDFLANLPYNRKPLSLYEPVKYVLSLGGKRIRPVLMLLGYNLFKNDPEKILMNAIALETYHNYTLLHDDLMDNADLRRGHETVHKKWDANTAILSGDSMLVLAYERMAQCDNQHLAKVMKLFTTTALEIGEGQQYDMEFENRNDVKEEEYIEMIRLKTSVLLACALKIGAILADASAEDADNLYKFGEQIGLAFQLQDDFLDVYGDSKVLTSLPTRRLSCSSMPSTMPMMPSVLNSRNGWMPRNSTAMRRWLLLPVSITRSVSTRWHRIRLPITSSRARSILML